MKIVIRSDHNEIDETLHRYINSQTKQAFSALAAEICSITISLHASLTNHSDEPKLCQVHISLLDDDPVVATGQKGHWLAAIDLAIVSGARATRRKANQLKKQAILAHSLNSTVVYGS